MNKIEQMHYSSIVKIYLDAFKVGGNARMDCEKAASKSAEITEQISIEFAEWCESNAAREKSGMWMIYSNPTIFLTKEQLFQEFLKTKTNVV